VELEELGRQISRVRRDRQLSQDELARACGLSRQTISALERGELTDLGLRKLQRLLETLELELALRPRHHPINLDDLAP
jgi:transcriptional regulator with XRE-family HTH domain